MMLVGWPLSHVFGKDLGCSSTLVKCVPRALDNCCPSLHVCAIGMRMSQCGFTRAVACVTQWRLDSRACGRSCDLLRVCLGLRGLVCTIAEAIVSAKIYALVSHFRTAPLTPRCFAAVTNFAFLAASPCAPFAHVLLARVIIKQSSPSFWIA